MSNRWHRAAGAALLALLLCLLAPAASAQVILDGGAPSFALDGHLAVLDDPDGRATVDEVAARADFRPVERPRLAHGTIWYRFSVLRRAGMPPVWYLAFGEPDIDDVRVFVPAGGGGWAEQRLGRRVPSEELPIAARRHVVRLALPEGEAVTVYLRLSSRHKVRFEEAALWRPGTLMFEEAGSAAAHGIHLGIFAVLVMVYGLFGLWLRDATMLLYAVFVATKAAGVLTHTAMVTLLFPGLGGDANYLLSGIGLLGSIAAFIFLWDRILDLRSTFPVMHRIFLVAGTAVALSLGAVFSPDFSRVVPPALAVMLAAGIASITMAGLLLRRNHDVLLVFYLVAFVPVALGWAVEAAAALTSLVPPDLGRGIDVNATRAHIAILSVALAYRLRRMQREWMGAQIALAGERLARQHLRTFVDMATHEFKTPLAVIDSAAQMVGFLTENGRPEIATRIANIRGAVQRLIGLVETCLAGERDLAARLRPVSPAAVVDAAARRNAHPDRPPIEVVTDRLPSLCQADPELLGIALDALIDNACRYGPQDRPVSVGARGDNGHVVFTVADRGPGVAPAEAERIFDKYYRGTNSAAIAGTGLGLHLVRTIAALHGGKVVCRPRDGGGTEFLLTIPVAAAA
jgi:signal transduction histidine kinase